MLSPQERHPVRVVILPLPRHHCLTSCAIWNQLRPAQQHIQVEEHSNFLSSSIPYPCPMSTLTFFIFTSLSGIPLHPYLYMFIPKFLRVFFPFWYRDNSRALGIREMAYLLTPSFRLTIFYFSHKIASHFNNITIFSSQSTYPQLPYGIRLVGSIYSRGVGNYIWVKRLI